MFKNAVLILSLLLNALVFYVVFFPSQKGGVRMTCEQARSGTENTKATSVFVQENVGSLEKTHEFLKNSDYNLRNISLNDGVVTFVYTAHSYPLTCGFHLPGIDGSILRVNTNIGKDSKVLSVD